jgi:predicted dehydrogenase
VTVAAPRYGILCVTGGRTHQESYALAFAADPRARIVAVTDEADVDAGRRELNERLAKRLGVPYIADLAAALARPDVSVCSICAPPDRRGRIALRCAEAGKHLYLDKPLSPTFEEAAALVAAARKAGIRTHMLTMVTQPWARAARRLVQEGSLGRVTAMHADCFFAKGLPGTAALGARRKEESPARRHQLTDVKRELDNVGIYPITLVHWLTGRRFESVFCVTANYFFGRYQQRDVEDFGLLSGMLEGGIPVTIAAGRYGWTSHAAGGMNRIVLVGADRTATVDANRPRLEVFNDDPPWTPPREHPEDPMAFWQSTVEEIKARPKNTWLPAAPPAATADSSYFLDCLDAGRESEMSVVQAAHGTEVLVAAYASAARGEPVRLPLSR